MVVRKGDDTPPAPKGELRNLTTGVKPDRIELLLLSTPAPEELRVYSTAPTHREPGSGGAPITIKGFQNKARPPQPQRGSMYIALAIIKGSELQRSDM